MSCRPNNFNKIIRSMMMIMSLIQIIHASVLPWPCYRMVIMLALIIMASCRILAYYPHYEPLWVINYYLHVCCRPLGDTNIDLALSIVYTQTQTFTFIHSLQKKCYTSCVMYNLLMYYPTNLYYLRHCNKIMPLLGKDDKCRGNYFKH